MVVGIVAWNGSGYILFEYGMENEEEIEWGIPDIRDGGSVMLFKRGIFCGVGDDVEGWRWNEGYIG